MQQELVVFVFYFEVDFIVKSMKLVEITAWIYEYKHFAMIMLNVKC